LNFEIWVDVMKIPLLPIHVMTSGTLEAKLKAVRDTKNNDIDELKAEHERQNELTIREIKHLLNENIAMRQMLSKYNIRPPEGGIGLKTIDERPKTTDCRPKTEVRN